MSTTKTALTKKILIVLSQLLVFFQSYSIFANGEGNQLIDPSAIWSMLSLGADTSHMLHQGLLFGLLLTASAGLFFRKSALYIVNGVFATALLFANGLHLDSLLITYEIASSSLLLVLSFFLAYWFSENANFEESWVRLQKNFVLFLSTLFFCQGVEILINSFSVFAVSFDGATAVWQAPIVNDVLFFLMLGGISLVTGFITLLNGRSIALQYLLLWGGLHMFAGVSQLTTSELSFITIVLPAAILAIEGIRFIVGSTQSEAFKNILLTNEASTATE